MSLAFRRFRAASVVPVAVSAILATTAAGGVLPRTRQRKSGAGTWTASTASCTATSAIRCSVFLSAASGIRCAQKLIKGTKVYPVEFFYSIGRIGLFKLNQRTINKMVDYMETESMKGNELWLLKERDNQRSLTHNNLSGNNDRTEPPARGCQENLPNYPTVLLFNDRGIERIGKREVERNLSSVCVRVERKWTDRWGVETDIESVGNRRNLVCFGTSAGVTWIHHQHQHTA